MNEKRFLKVSFLNSWILLPLIWKLLFYESCCQIRGWWTGGDLELKGSLIVDEPGKMGGGLELTSSSLMNQVRWKEVWNSSAPRCLTRWNGRGFGTYRLLVEEYGEMVLYSPAPHWWTRWGWLVDGTARRCRVPPGSPLSGTSPWSPWSGASRQAGLKQNHACN